MYVLIPMVCQSWGQKGTFVMQSNKSTVSFTINAITDPTIQSMEHEHGECHKTSSSCPNCGSKKSHYTYSRSRTVLDAEGLTVNEQQTIVHWFKCNRCGKVFTPIHNIYPRNLQSTENYKALIAYKILCENCSIENALSIFPSSKGYISELCNTYIDQFFRMDWEIPRFHQLYFKKIRYKNKEVCAVLCAPRTNSKKFYVLDILKEYNPDLLEKILIKAPLDKSKCHVCFDFEFGIAKMLEKHFNKNIVVPTSTLSKKLRNIHNTIPQNKETKDFYRAALNLFDAKETSSEDITNFINSDNWNKEALSAYKPFLEELFVCHKYMKHSCHGNFTSTDLVEAAITKQLEKNTPYHFMRTRILLMHHPLFASMTPDERLRYLIETCPKQTLTAA